MGNPPPTELIVPISYEERLALLHETMDRSPDPSVIRIFGYGSLMWSPCFDYVDRRRATLNGYHRGFSIWTVFARGTPERPGLGFALEEMPGAGCEGVVFTLPDRTSRDDLIPLWEREMWTRTYRPEWVRVVVDGVSVSALTFVVSVDHPQYAGNLPVAEKAAYIARAAGKYGTCYDYLAETVREMTALGIHDAELEELLAMTNKLT